MASKYDAKSDAELLRRSGRDPEAFGLLYDRHAATVLAYFQRRTACAESAADLTAETFAAAFCSRRRYRDTGVPAIAWILGIARHLLADRSGTSASRIEPAGDWASNGSSWMTMRCAGLRSWPISHQFASNSRRRSRSCHPTAPRPCSFVSMANSRTRRWRAVWLHRGC